MDEQLAPLREIFAAVLEVPLERIDDRTSPERLRSWDSLRHVELIIEVEQRYGVSFAATEIFAMTSLRAFRDALAKKGVVLSHAGA